MRQNRQLSSVMSPTPVGRRRHRCRQSCQPATHGCACMRHDHAIGGATATRGTTMAPAQRWDADEAVTQLYAAHYTGTGPAGRAARPQQRRGRGDRPGRVRRDARQVAPAARAREGARLPAPQRRQRGPVGQRHHKVADRHLRRATSHALAVEPSAEHARSRARDARGRDGGARPASAATARGAGAALLQRPDRARHRRRPRYQPRRGQEPRLPRHQRPPHHLEELA